MTSPKTKQRIANAIHYIVARTSRHELGATKLNKVLWLADQMAWRERQESLTGLKSYIRMPQGPVPECIGDVLASLKSNDLIIEIEEPTPVGNRREFVSNVHPSLDGFTAQDIDLINRAIDYITLQSASLVSEQTHDAYWDELVNGDDMSIAAAAVWFEPPDIAAIEWARSVLSA